MEGSPVRPENQKDQHRKYIGDCHNQVGLATAVLDVT